MSQAIIVIRKLGVIGVGGCTGYGIVMQRVGCSVFSWLLRSPSTSRSMPCFQVPAMNLPVTICVLCRNAVPHFARSHARLRMLFSQVNAPAGNKNAEQPAISWSAPLPFKVCSIHMQQT